MSGLTGQAAAFVSGLTFAAIPPDAVRTVARGFADCAGVMMLGSAEPVTRIAASAEMTDTAGESAVLWNAARARADVAALVNGTAAHALDFDDTGLEAHPSAVLVPAILALGEATGADGRALVTAYVAGFEVWADLASRDADRYHKKGIHPTAAFGAIAAAAASASLLKLDAAHATAALSLAASMAGGITANFGTMTKPYQVGRAAESGIRAARLAAAGLTAAADGLGGPHGFLAAFSPSGRVDLTRPPAYARDWRIVESGLSFKLHPACYAAHRIVDSARAIAGAIAAADIAAIDVEIGRTQDVMLRARDPCDPLDARFSAEYAVASTLIDGDLGLASFDPARIERPEVRGLMKTIRRVVTDAEDPANPGFAPADRVTVHLRDGSSVSGPAVAHPRGHARNPAEDSALRQKFRACVSARFDGPAADRLFDRLTAIEHLAAVADLYR